MGEESQEWNSNHTLITISICFSVAILSVVLSMFSLVNSSRCNGYPLFDQVIQNEVEDLYLKYKNAVDDYNAGDLNETRSRRTVLSVTDNILQKLLLGYEHGDQCYKRRGVAIFNAKIYDCWSNKIVYTSLHGQKSLMYENSMKSGNIHTLTQMFSSVCSKPANFMNSLYKNRNKVDRKIITNVTLDVIQSKFASGLLTDFPSPNISKKRLYILPISVNTNRHIQNRIVIFSSYPIDYVC